MIEYTKVEYRVSTETVGGRENGNGRSCDGLLDVRLAVPGAARIGTNPEQLFGVAWSGSFASAIKQSALRKNIDLPNEIKIRAEVELANCDAGYLLRVQLEVHVPDFDRDLLNDLIDDARQVCAYCRATRDNVEVEFNLR